MSKDNGGPAFPFITEWRADGFGAAANTGYEVTNAHGGMTLRDYFAAKADLSNTKIHRMADAESLLGSSCPSDPVGAFKWECKLVAKIRYVMADAMLEARK